jgi:serine/threonine protein kinase
MREAQASARLNHPNIASIYDVGKEGTRYFLVMELINGASLRGLIEANPKGLEPSQALQIAMEVCRALRYAHSHGVVHRDVKPENIMLTEDGTAKLMDFGLARALDKPRMTREGMMIGTPAYMAPENALGKESDARSDIYSLGCVLYEMVSGSPPFRTEDTLKLIYSHIHDTPLPLSRISPEVPALLDAIVRKAMMKNPDGRYQSASDLLRSLEEASKSLERTGGEYKVSPTVSAQEGKRISTPDLRRSLPLIDRENELQSLKNFLDASSRGEGAVVFLTGEAGIGKTRLAEEIRTYATLRGSGPCRGSVWRKSPVFHTLPG